ncbi:hypothetical protein XELAEV_18022247mg [Xenopus laevis]|uniref:Uncharacterized protein n=1 Tax=Xenopus laevis TaxID=8355 RepID=A0A974HNI8_XENLA|nr:hypothetical protein XELAEV_18022247mg [Xenopus laevis]
MPSSTPPSSSGILYHSTTAGTHTYTQSTISVNLNVQAMELKTQSFYLLPLPPLPAGWNEKGTFCRSLAFLPEDSLPQHSPGLTFFHLPASSVQLNIYRPRTTTMSKDRWVIVIYLIKELEGRFV